MIALAEINPPRWRQLTHSSRGAPHNGILLGLAHILMGTLPRPGKTPDHIETPSSDNSHNNKKRIFTGLPKERGKKPSFSVTVVVHVFFAPQHGGSAGSSTWGPVLSRSSTCWFL